MNVLEEKLILYAQHNLNVLLVGAHGIGKSSIFKKIAGDIGCRYKYFSCSTLDPYTDLTGVPVPNQQTKYLDFFKPEFLKDVEFLFFDELNRPSHPRILNAIFELIQFKSINGEPLPNLKMIWGAINPSGEEYQVDDLDPALLDRFHVYIKMQAEIDIDYFKTKMDEQLAHTLRRWWLDLDDTQRKILTPRRMEYIGCMIEADLPWRDALPQGHTFPDGSLDKMIRILRKEDDDIELTKENILEKRVAVLQKLKEDPKVAIKISQVMTRFNEKELYLCRDIIENLPKELVVKIGGRKMRMSKRKVREFFDNDHVDITLYPKMAEVWEF